MRHQKGSSTHRQFRAFLAGLVATCLAMPAAAIEIPNVPPTSGNGVPPNIWFILDDSGSMTYPTMPAAVRSRSMGDNISHRSYVHNYVYYNPAITYLPWLGWDGKRLEGGTSYEAAYVHSTEPKDAIDLTKSTGSGCGTSTENDSDQKVCGGEQIFYVPKDTSRTDASYLSDSDNYYRYTIDTSKRIWRQERSGGSWGTRVRATPLAERSEAQELENYATWFSYHRTRTKAAKAGASEAFGELAGENYRVGFTTIWQNNELRIPVGNDDGLFRGENRKKWFQRLLKAGSSGTTPLHAALDRAGKYFSESASDGPYGGRLGPDNKQLQCRQNFSILTSDGYWNGSAPSGINNADNSAGSWIYGPLDPVTNEPVSKGRYEAVAPYKGGNSVTLADVAAYYWKRDLRTDLANVVPVSAANPAFWQHMVTFGISIGLAGTVDQNSVKEVLEYGGVSIGGVRQSDWPNPMDAENRERIDDLLHAAVNGRGEFVAASDPAAFREGLRSALATINDRTASASNVATSSTSLNTGSMLFQGIYNGGQWSGDLRAVPVVNRQPDNGSPAWRASEQMPTSAATRKVFTFDGSGKEFKYSALSSATRAAFGQPAIDGLTVEEVARRRIDYIRGDASHERSNGGPFRNRYRPVAGRVPLGDIIHSSPVHMENVDAARANALFVGANDGMLHAFNPANGSELFAYVPKGLDTDALVDLSSPTYSHAYFVDGPVVVSRPAPGDTQHVLVGSLGRGGKGLYALDVSNPGNFGASDVLWDKTTQGSADRDLGFVLGRPIIATVGKDATRAVIFGNGPNSADGKAVLYVLDLEEGTEIARIDTGVGGDNALGPPTGWDADGDGTVDYVYAGDMHGNVWKFDLTDNNAKQWSVALGGSPLFTATDAAGKAQPITGAVSVSLDPTTYKRWVVAGTGRLYNDSDLWNADGTVNTSVQSIYGVHDQSASGLGRRADIAGKPDGLAVRTITVAGVINGRPVRGFEPSDTGLTVHQKGWVVDLLAPPAPGTAEGERVVGDVQVVAGVMVFSTMIPGTNPCEPGGRGYLNALNAFTGASVTEHFFDVDGDGQFSDDEIGGGGGGGPGGGGDDSVPVGSVDLGLGGNTDPGWMTPLVCVNGVAGETGCIPYASSAVSGRLSWREILRN